MLLSDVSVKIFLTVCIESNAEDDGVVPNECNFEQILSMILYKRLFERKIA